MRITICILSGIVIAVMTAWCAGAIYFMPLPGGQVLWGVFAVIFTASTLLAFILLPRRGRTLIGFLAAFTVFVLFWLNISASNDREWQPDVAVLASATMDSDIVKVHNIRNCDYRSETDYTPVYYDKSFDLNKLEGVDLVAVYWMGPNFAHIFVSFAFAGGEHLAISIETRKEMGENYSTIKGFFRQYELYYVVADERDLIRLRTNYRRDPPENVYLFRLHSSIENCRRLFIEYIKKINSLNTSPEFYNTLTTNCTTNIWFHSLVNPEHLPFSWKILASGHVPEYFYEAGWLDNSMPFNELKRLSLVNARARSTDQNSDFSKKIREGLPGF